MLWFRNKPSHHVAYHRTFVRHGGNGKGGAVVRELAKPRIIEIFGEVGIMELNGRIMAEAADLLRCEMEEVVLLDQGHTKTAWRFNGRFADVVEYTRV